MGHLCKWLKVRKRNLATVVEAWSKVDEYSEFKVLVID